MVVVTEDTAHWLPVSQWPDDPDKKCLLAIERISAIASELITDVERALKWLDEAKDKEIWKFTKWKNFDEYIASRNLEESAINEYRIGLSILKRHGWKGKVAGSEARKAAVQKLANSGEQQAAEADARKGGRGKKVVANGNRFTKGQNNTDYLTRRIARDRPDILERMKAGEFTSVRQAALAAKIVKPTFTCPIDPERAANLILKHFELKNVKTLIQLLNSGISNRKT